MILSDFVSIISDKCDGSSLSASSYLSTENMLPNLGGYVDASSVPDAKVTKFQAGDILLSNIRPYFKKMVFARTEGGCSNDVVDLRANERLCLSKYLYYALSTDSFFDYYTATCKGTKMPRGDKTMLMKFELELPSVDDQRHIVGIIGSVDDLIEKNQEKMSTLMKHALTLFDLESTKVGTEKLGRRIRFVKGKKPVLPNGNDSLPYLSIDALTGQEPVCSSSGLLCGEDDVLMVMDGASSGKVFTGFRGYVGSTLAKVVTDLPASMVYIFLYKHQSDSMDNTKGSAIPHADKGYIGELEIPMISDPFVINKLSADLKLITLLRKENESLKQIKNALLKKYF